MKQQGPKDHNGKGKHEAGMGHFWRVPGRGKAVNDSNTTKTTRTMMTMTMAIRQQSTADDQTVDEQQLPQRAATVSEEAGEGDYSPSTRRHGVAASR